MGASASVGGNVNGVGLAPPAHGQDPPGDFAQWTTDDLVLHGLLRLGREYVDSYGPILREQGVTGQSLLSLGACRTESALECGVLNFVEEAHRSAIAMALSHHCPRAQSDCCTEEEEEVEEDFGVRTVAVFSVGRSRVRVASGSVVDFTGDVVVNAANEGGLGGGGVDGAISRKGGAVLMAARNALPVVSENDYGDDVRIPTGTARTTVAGDMESRWVVHAVGPCFSSSEKACHRGDDELLASAYEHSIREATAKGAKTIAFSLISAGIFSGARGLADVLEVSCEAVRDALLLREREGVERQSPLPALDVFLVAFTEEELTKLTAAAKRLLGAIGGSGTDLTAVAEAARSPSSVS